MKVSKKRSLILLFFILAIVAFLISITNGSLKLSVGEVIRAIFTQADTTNSTVIMNIRLPRILLAILVGINLSLSGVILQSVMKNPLADPGIIGVSAGAGLFGMIILILFPHMSAMLPPFTFIGAMLACILIYILSWKNGIRPVRVILSGVAISSLFGAGISALMVFYSDRLQNAVVFMAGSLSGTSWPHVHIILPYTVIGLILTFLYKEQLNLLMLGDDTAASLGLNVNRARLGLTAVAAMLAASAVSVVGLLGFVGLIVPHITRLVIGSDHKYLVPGTAILGAFTLTLSDMLARTLFSPIEIPVGIIMAIFGAPFFLYLLRRAM